MENQFVVVDPVSEFPHDFDFSNIHYFRVVNSFAKRGEYCWIILTGNKISKKKFGLFYDFESEYEYEKEYIDEIIEVKAMIELQQSSYEANEIWLKFFEVAPEFKNQGLSKVMISEIIKVFKDKYSDKILSRSSPSSEGEQYLKQNFSKALKEAGIAFKFSK